MKIKITYRKDSKPIILVSNEKNIRRIAKDCAKQLTKNYKQWRDNNHSGLTDKQLKRYEIGQEFMLIMKLEELIK